MLPAALALVLVAVCFASSQAPTAQAQGAVVGEVRYLARDQRDAWVGVAPLRVEVLEVDVSDLGSARLEAVVRVGELRSGNALRDLQARNFVFAASEYPEIRFVLSGVDHTGPLEPGRSLAVTVSGDLSIRGVERELVLDVTLRHDGDALVVTAAFEVSLAAYGLPAPRFLTLVVDDRVGVEVDASWPLDPDSTATTRAPAPAGPAAAARPPTGWAARR